MAAYELGIKYTLSGPDGTVATFNDPFDANYVGVLTEITGLDSPDVRENADDLVGFDGGIHGDFFYGRRPVVMSGIILNPTTVTDRNNRMDKLARASEALRADATLSWTPTGGEERYLKVRRQQALRMTGAWQKQFQLALVAADPRIYSSTLYQATLLANAGTNDLVVNNAGTTPTYPTFNLTGSLTNPVVQNLTDTFSGAITLSYTVPSSQTVELDNLNKTARNLNTAASIYSTLSQSYPQPWIKLLAGNNTIRLTESANGGGASGITVKWRNAWM